MAVAKLIADVLGTTPEIEYGLQRVNDVSYPEYFATLAFHIVRTFALL